MHAVFMLLRDGMCQEYYSHCLQYCACEMFCVIMHTGVSPSVSIVSIGLQLGYFFGRANRDYVIFERNNVPG